MLKKLLNSPRTIEWLILASGLGIILWFGVSAARNYFSIGASGIPLGEYGKRDDLKESAEEQNRRYQRMRESVMP